MVARLPPIGHQPVHGCAVAARGVDCPCVAVEEEREEDLEGLRLAGTVLASEQRPPTAELDLGPVVLPDVDHSGAVEHPATDRFGGAEWRSEQRSGEELVGHGISIGRVGGASISAGSGA